MNCCWRLNRELCLHQLKTLLGDSRKRAAAEAPSQRLTEKAHRETQCKIKSAQTVPTAKLSGKAPHGPQKTSQGRAANSHETRAPLASVLERGGGSNRASDGLEDKTLSYPTGSHRKAHITESSS